MARYAVIAVGVFVALEILGLEKAVTSLLAGAGIAGLAIGIAFQDLAANFIAGVIMSIRRPFEEDDLVQTSEYLGFLRKGIRIAYPVRSLDLAAAESQSLNVRVSSGDG
ncbi:MAG: mechanosensitive ion channel [Myxococcales bacterium]|jgi:small conductance mechanosensitive channel